MPLPPAPQRKASRLTPEAFEVKAPARPTSRAAETPIQPKQPQASTALPAPQEAAARAPGVKRKAIKAAATPTAAPKQESELKQQAAVPAQAPEKPKRRAKVGRHGAGKRLFVLDTNVLMHDPMSLFRFEEHDIYLPMIVLEELDSNKKGMSEVARNARRPAAPLTVWPLMAATTSLAVCHLPRWATAT